MKERKKKKKTAVESETQNYQGWQNDLLSKNDVLYLWVVTMQNMLMVVRMLLGGMKITYHIS